jgi:hypothetical protein
VVHSHDPFDILDVLYFFSRSIDTGMAFWSLVAVLTHMTRQIDAGNHRTALTMTENLLKELKQLDDKIILTEVFLLESRAAHAIQNLPRAKVSASTPDNQVFSAGCSLSSTQSIC